MVTALLDLPDRSTRETGLKVYLENAGTYHSRKKDVFTCKVQGGMKDIRQFSLRGA